MSNLTKALILALALPFAQNAAAQDSTATPPATNPAAATDTKPADAAAPAGTDATPPAADGGLSMGKDVIGSSYFKDTFDDWKMRCVHAKDSKDPCELYQLIKDDQDNPVSEVSIFPLPQGGQAVAGATVITPLETLLTRELTLQIDGASAKRYPFTWCNQVGCIARVGFTAEDLAAFKKGVKATLTIVPVAAPTQTIDLTMSLKGFTAGYEAVTKSNADNGISAAPAGGN